jgi:hypothetical protein
MFTGKAAGAVSWPPCGEDGAGCRLGMKASWWSSWISGGCNWVGAGIPRQRHQMRPRTAAVVPSVTRVVCTRRWRPSSSADEAWGDSVQSAVAEGWWSRFAKRCRAALYKSTMLCSCRAMRLRCGAVRCRDGTRLVGGKGASERYRNGAMVVSGK